MKARLRHAQFYLDKLRKLSQQYAAGGDNISVSLNRFTQEWDQLVQGQSAAATYAEASDNEALIICSDYPNAGSELLGWKQHPNEHIRWQLEALAAAEKLGVSEIAVVYLNNLGNASIDLGEYQQAVDYFERALEVAQDSGNRSGEGSVFGNLGRVFSEVGEYQQAIDFYHQSLIIFQELEDKGNQLLALGSLGIAYKNIGDYSKAKNCYEEAKTLAIGTGDLRSQGKLAGNLGILFAIIGDLDQAVRYFEEDLAIAEKLEDTRGIGQTLLNLGNVLRSRGEFEKAREAYIRRLKIAEDLNDLKGEFLALLNLGNLCIDRQEAQEACGYFQSAYNKSLALGDYQSQSISSWNWAIALYQSGHLELAIAKAKESYALLENPGNASRDQVREVIEAWEKNYPNVWGP